MAKQYPDLYVAPSAFATTYNDLLVVEKTNQGSPPDTDADTKAIAQWANLVDTSILRLQQHVTAGARNVLTYGAIPDGVTDNSAAIQSAIDAANTAGGGTVLISLGTAAVTAGLTLYSGVRLVYVTDSDPEGDLQATDGDLAIRTTGATSLYVKTGGTGNTGWISGADEDHGNLGGLGDDDHPQYLLVDGSRTMTGNLTVGSGTGVVNSQTFRNPAGSTYIGAAGNAIYANGHLYPGTHNLYSFGAPAQQWKDFHSDAGHVYTSFVLGDGTANVTQQIVKSTFDGSLYFRQIAGTDTDGDVRLQHDAGNTFSIYRRIGGTYYQVQFFTDSAISLGASVYNNVQLNNASGPISLHIRSGATDTAGIIFVSGGQQDWAFESRGANQDLIVNRYINNVFQGTPLTILNASGNIQFGEATKEVRVMGQLHVADTAPSSQGALLAASVPGLAASFAQGSVCAGNSPGGLPDAYGSIVAGASQTAAHTVSTQDGVRDMRAQFFLTDDVAAANRYWGLWQSWNSGGTADFVVGMSNTPVMRITQTNYAVTFSDADGDAVTKKALLGTRHYTAAEEPFIGIRIQSASGDNNLALGGGWGGGNAANTIDFYVAPNSTTLSGTARWRMIENAFYPQVDNTIALGQSALRMSQMFGYTLDLGNTTTAGAIYLHKPAAAGGAITFRQANGSDTANDKRILHASDEDLSFQHHNGTGWADILSINAGGFTVEPDDPAVLLGSGNGTGVATYRFRRGSAAGVIEVYFQEGGGSVVGDKRIRNSHGSGDTLAFQHYSGSWDDALIISGSDVSISYDLNLSTFINMTDRASITDPAVGSGRWWVLDTSPNTAMFTADDGLDRPLSHVDPIRIVLSNAGRLTNVTRSAGAASTDELLSYDVSASTGRATFTFVMPSNYAGQAVKVKVMYYIPSSTGAAGTGENFDLSLDFDVIASNTAIGTTTYDTANASNQVPAGTDTQYTATIAIPAADLDGAAANDIVRCRVSCTNEVSSVNTVNITAVGIYDDAA